MPPELLDDDEVHVLEAGVVRRSRWPMLLGLLTVVALAGAGAWVWAADPFSSRAEGTRAPEPEPGNLLLGAWSFETTEKVSPGEAWIVPAGAPAGFAFDERSVVSGVTGASAQMGDDGWARIVSAERLRIPSGGRVVRLSATSSSDDVQLLLQFESSDRMPLAVVVASGSGRLEGTATTPPGYTHVRAGLGAVGEGGADDLDLRFDAEPGDALLNRGLFDVLPLGSGFAVFRADELVLQARGSSVADAEQRRLPATASWMPGEGALARIGGGRVTLAREMREEGDRIVATSRFGSLGAGEHVVSELVVTGSLAEHPIGVGSARGFETFTDDARIEGVQSLVLGRSPNRLLLRGEREVTAALTWRSDGTIALLVEWPTDASGSSTLTLQTSFQDERVQAAQLRDRASDEEHAGRLGAALAALDRIVTEFPFDEGVLAEARASRGRLQAGMQARLDAIDRDLEDALFLASATRCREVMQDCLRAAGTYAGSDAAARFREAARIVATRAADLLDQDRERRAKRVQAVRDSFAGAGGYDSVVAELDEYLARHLSAEADAPTDSPADGTAEADDS